MTVLLSSYGIIMDRKINATCHGNNVVGVLNATEKLSFQISRVSIIGSMEYGKTRNDFFRSNASKII